MHSHITIALVVLSVASCFAGQTAEAGHPKRSVLAPAPTPPLVYGFGVPTPRYGWFGVEYRPRKVYHNGFYNNYSQWGYWQGY